MNIDPERLAKLEDLTLHIGSHRSFDAGHCSMEAVAWLAGEDHTDQPACVSPVVGAFVRNWNDSLSTDADRSRLIRPLLPLMVGTRDEHDSARADLVVHWLVTECAPAFMELTPALRKHAERLRAVKDFREATDAIKAAEDAARAAARAAAGDAVWDAAGAAARAAAEDAVWDAAGDAARAAAGAAAWAAARAAARAAALAPTVARLQDSAQDLLRRMCEVGR